MTHTNATSATISLAGDWQFQLDPDGSYDHTTIAPDRTIAVPLPWQAADPALRRYGGYAWYRRTLTLDASWSAGEALLRFGAVDYWCRVWVNEMLAGEHEGGYTPFTFAVGSLLHAGENSITVQVYDPVQTGITVERWPDQHPAGAAQSRGAAGPPFDAQDVPHGKQEWYINVGGIWQDVTLEAVPRAWIDQIHVTPDIEAGSATVRVRLAGDEGMLAGATLRLSIQDGEREVALVETRLSAGQIEYRAALSIPEPKLWDTERPHLYSARVELALDEAAHSRTVRFGMRSFGFQQGRFLLNGSPVYLRSALDQDLYPETIYTVPSEAFLRDQFQKAKELGLNSLRCHIKPPDPRYLDLADELGLLIWSEVPSWRTFFQKGTLFAHQHTAPSEVRARVEKTLEEIIARDFNHPSLVIWTLVNEDWGTALPLSASDRAWVTSLYKRCKQLDPTRLAVDNSPCHSAWAPNVHVVSDVDDFHIYAAIPDQAQSFAQSVRQLALRPLWTYSAHGDARRRGDEPLVLSEFGNWGLPSLAALRASHGGDPPWLDLGAWWSGWSGEPGWPEGVEQRFDALGLGAIWPDYEALAHATQLHQYEAMKFEIEAMRREPTLAGYVITEFTDVYWESNGLLDFARNPKAYHDQFVQVNGADTIIAWPARRAFWTGERAVVPLRISHYSGGASDGAVLRWRLTGSDAGGELTVAPVGVGEVQAVGAIALALPEPSETTELRLELELLGRDGTPLTRNELGLTVYPASARAPRLHERVAVVEDREHPHPTMTSAEQGAPELSGVTASHPVQELGTQPESRLGRLSLAALLTEAGYEVSRGLDPDASVAVSTAPDEALLRWVAGGGDLLFVCEGPSPFFWAQGRGGAYGGNWATAFSWVRPEIHPSLPKTNPLGMAYTGLMPQHTIVGLPMEDPALHGDLLAGMFAGWIQHPAIHTVQLRYGRGRVVMTTFALRDTLGVNPTATAMLHDLLAYLRSDRCQPSLKATYPTLRD